VIKKLFLGLKLKGLIKTITGAVLLAALVLVAVFLSNCFRKDVHYTWDFEGLRVTLSSPKRTYEIGETVTIYASVENITHETILWQSARTKHPDYVFDVNVDGTWLSSVYPELQVDQRELKPGEKVEVTYTFLPEKQENQSISVDAYIYYRRGVAQDFVSINLDYGHIRY